MRLKSKVNSNIAKVKAIAMSGYASEQDRHTSLSAGFDLHVNKPFDISSLVAAINN